MAWTSFTFRKGIFSFKKTAVMEFQR